MLELPIQIEFTPDELREVHDALSRYVEYMIEVGQTPQEIQYSSLEVAWSAQQKAVAALLPGSPPEWVKARHAQVKQAVRNPIRIQESNQS